MFIIITSNLYVFILSKTLKIFLHPLFFHKLFGKKCPDKCILLNLYILCNRQNNMPISPEKEVCDFVNL